MTKTVITGPAWKAPAVKTPLGSPESLSAATVSTAITATSGQVSQRLTRWIQW